VIRVQAVGDVGSLAPKRSLQRSRKTVAVHTKSHQTTRQIEADSLSRIIDAHEPGEHVGVVIRIGVIVDGMGIAKFSHLPVAAGLEKRGIEPEKGFIAAPDMVTDADDVELISDQFLVRDSTALGQAPAPERARVENDQAALGETSQMDEGFADSHSGGSRNSVLAGHPDASHGVKHPEVRFGFIGLHRGR
jgi:hypothetical protein